MTTDLPILAWYTLWALVALSVVTLAGLAIASAYPPAWAVIRRLWGGLSYVVTAAGVLVVVGVLMLIAGVRRRRRQPRVMPGHDTERDVGRARAEHAVQVVEAERDAAQSEARTEAAVADPDPAAGWAAMDAERERLRSQR